MISRTMPAWRIRPRSASVKKARPKEESASTIQCTGMPAQVAVPACAGTTTPPEIYFGLGRHTSKQ